jgi:DNA-binding NtrC family response regulator
LARIYDYTGLKGLRLLMVDDEAVLTEFLREAVAPAVSAFETASRGATALKRIAECDFDFILLDIKMPGMDGVELYGRIKEIKPHLLGRIIFITGDAESDSIRSFLKHSGCAVLCKPFMAKDLLRLISDLVDLRARESENPIKKTGG